MLDMFRRMFGMGPGRQTQRATIQYMQNDEGTERVILQEDHSPQAIAARHNMGMIYGKANVPATFGMRPVIEVRDAGGNWMPVSGSKDIVPDTDAQVAFLQNYRKTGQIGVTPMVADSIAGTGLPAPAAQTAPDPFLTAAATGVAAQVVGGTGAQSQPAPGAGGQPAQPAFSPTMMVPQALPVMAPSFMPTVMGPNGLPMPSFGGMPNMPKQANAQQTGSRNAPQMPDVPQAPDKQPKRSDSQGFVADPYAVYRDPSLPWAAPITQGQGRGMIQIPQLPAGMVLF